MDLPLIGSYDLEAKPHSVQRTVNLIPVPQEPGNERTGWVLKDVKGLDLFGLDLEPIPVEAVSPVAGNWYAGAYNPSGGVYVIVGQGDKCIRSIDNGRNWTQENMTSSQTWVTVRWAEELGLFCALANNYAFAATSPDGETWTNNALPVTVTAWGGLAWNGATFCAPDNNGANQRALTSANGVTWTSNNTGLTITTSSWANLTYAPELGYFVMLGFGENRVARSTNGVTWTESTMPFSSNWREIEWNGSVFVASSFSTGVSACASSPDGIVWTSRTLPATQQWSTVRYSNSLAKFYISPYGGTTAAYSSDGVTWLSQTLATDHRWYAMAGGEVVVLAPNDAGTSTALLVIES